MPPIPGDNETEGFELNEPESNLAVTPGGKKGIFTSTAPGSFPFVAFRVIDTSWDSSPALNGDKNCWDDSIVNLELTSITLKSVNAHIPSSAQISTGWNPLPNPVGTASLAVNTPEALVEFLDSEMGKVLSPKINSVISVLDENPDAVIVTWSPIFPEEGFSETLAIVYALKKSPPEKSPSPPSLPPVLLNISINPPEKKSCFPMTSKSTNKIWVWALVLTFTSINFGPGGT